MPLRRPPTPAAGWMRHVATLALILSLGLGWGMLHPGSGAGQPVAAQATTPTVLDPQLAVRTVAAGLSQLTSMAFLGPSDILVLQKQNGQVRRVVNGTVQSTPVLDLAVNAGS